MGNMQIGKGVWGSMKQLLVGFWALVMALSPTLYGHDIEHDEALKLRQSGQILPLETLLASALKRYPSARLLDAELEEDDGLFIYEIELLTQEGVVRELELNAATGAILKDELD